MRTIIKILARITKMSKEDQQNLNDLLDQIEEKYGIEDMNDLDAINEITRDDLTINNIEDLLEVDWENLDFESIDFDDFEKKTDGFDGRPSFGFFDIYSDKDGISDPRVDDIDIDNYKIDPKKPEERVDINLNMDDIEKEFDYQGDKWVQFGDKYKTFVNIPKEVEDCDVNIILKNKTVEISDPIDKTVNTDEIPKDIQNISAEVKNNNIIIVAK